MSRQFKKHTLFTFDLIYLIVIIVIAGFSGWMLFQSGLMFWLILTVVIGSMVFLSLFYILYSKIVLTSDSLICKTPFSVRKMDFSEIKTVGVYLGGFKTFPIVITPEKYDERRYILTKYIYISTIENHNLISAKSRKEYISFLYNRELFDLLQERISKH